MKTKLLTLLVLHLGLAAVVAQPVITNQPQNQTAIAGTTAMFTVGATGAPPLSYQWRSHATATSFTNIPFGTEATLVLTNVQPTTRRFAVVVTDAGGLSATSSPLVTLTVVSPPSIATEPSNQNAVAGESATLSVVAAGTAPLSHQWYFNSQPRSGANSSNLVFASVQLSNAGVYQVIITNLYGAATSHVAELSVGPATSFTKITNGAIVTESGSTGAWAWGDYDGDGFIDLIVTGAVNSLHPSGVKILLFRNNGDGSFSKITNSPVTVEARDWRFPSWVDYDNDGDLDLYLTSVPAPGVASENELFRNNGDVSFTKMTADVVGPLVSADVAVDGSSSEGASWADFDRDGFLDLFVARYGSDWLYHNEGDGTFTQVTNQQLGVLANDRTSYSGMWGDYDNDGWPDLFVPVIEDDGSDQRNFLYHNLGAGTFTRVTSGAIATDNEGTWTGNWGDYDNDGFLDLVVVNGSHSLATATNSLFHNNGDGTFTKMNRADVGSLPGDAGVFGSALWGDYDNDGFLDLFVTQIAGVNFLYHNNRDGTFTRILHSSLVAENGVTFGGTWGDYDNDGFLDVFLGRGGDIHDETNQLFHNDGNSNGWIKLKLVGTVSNRSGVGAKIRIRATIFGGTQWQLREIGIGVSGSPLDAHFGLGDATNVETLRIEWPSGTVQEFHDVAPRRSLAITEPPRLSAARIGSQPQLILKGGRNMSYDIQASTNLVDWSPDSSVTITNFKGTAPIAIPMPANEPQKYYRAVLR